MTVVTETGVTLSLLVGTQEVACQLVDPQMVRPWAGEGDTTRNACGDTVVDAADTPERGSITGDAFADYSATGITRTLDAALGQVVDVTYVETTGDYVRTWVGKGLVQPITRTWRVGPKLRHDVNIALTEETSNTYTDAPTGP